MTTRILTAIVFVAVMLGGLYGGVYAFVGLFTLITACCLWELIGMSLKDEDLNHLRSYQVMGTVVGLIPVFLIGVFKLQLPENPGLFLYRGILISIPLMFLVFVRELYAKTEKPFSNIAHVFLGLVYIGFPFAMLLYVAIEGDTYFPNTVLGLLLLTWANDSGAYIIGSQIGKTPLFPRISPNKTWEGSIGGALTALAASFLLSRIFPEQTTLTWMVLASLTVIFGSIGDLIESMLKRSKGVKDSGTIMPGHGGFLDRFDAFIFLLPFAAAYLLYIK